VIEVVPASFGDSCVATDPLPAGAVGGVTCTEGDLPASYSSYTNLDDLSQAFARSTAGLELTGVSCRDDSAANDFYAVDGAQRGAVACFVDHPTPLEFVPTIVWTDETLSILGYATTGIVTDHEGNVPDLSFYEWWRTSAGPGPNRNFREKDDPAELLSGTYRSTITRDQVGPTNEGGADDRWVGTWTIVLDGTEFVESFKDGLTQSAADQTVTGDQPYRSRPCSSGGRTNGWSCDASTRTGSRRLEVSRRSASASPSRFGCGSRGIGSSSPTRLLGRRATTFAAWRPSSRGNACPDQPKRPCSSLAGSKKPPSGRAWACQ
jgi:hypothetical protein